MGLSELIIGQLEVVQKWLLNSLVIQAKPSEAVESTTLIQDVDLSAVLEQINVIEQSINNLAIICLPHLVSILVL